MSAMRTKTASAMSNVSHLKAWSPKCHWARFASVVSCLVICFVAAGVTRLKLPRKLLFLEPHHVGSYFFTKNKRTKSGRNCALRPAHANKTTRQRREVII